MFEEIRAELERNYNKSVRAEQRRKQQEALDELNDRAKGYGFSPESEKANCYMDFDGKNLSMYRGNELQYQVPAMSGNPSYQNRDYQNLENRGPLPEGVYYTNNREPANILKRATAQIIPGIEKEVPTDHNYVQHINGWDEFWGKHRRGDWRGGSNAWGNSRISLLPDENNDMMGRGNFFIHGGTTPGSAGCVDITRYMPVMESFANTCQPNIPVRVNYPKQNW